MAALGLALAFLSRRGEAMRNASDFERIDELLNRGRLERSRAALRGIRSVDATVRRVVESIVTRMRRRSAYLALQRLDDRTLKDIGVYRCELWRVAAGDVRRVSAIAASVPFDGEAPEPANTKQTGRASCRQRRGKNWSIEG